MKLLWISLVISVSLAPGLTRAAPKADPAGFLEEPRWASAGRYESFSALSALSPEASISSNQGIDSDGAWNRSWGSLRNDDDFRWVSDDGWRHHDDDRGPIGAVPEPSSWMLLSLGAALVAVVKVRRLTRL